MYVHVIKHIFILNLLKTVLHKGKIKKEQESITKKVSKTAATYCKWLQPSQRARTGDCCMCTQIVSRAAFFPDMNKLQQKLQKCSAVA